MNTWVLIFCYMSVLPVELPQQELSVMPQMIYKKHNPTNRKKKGMKGLKIAYALLQTNRKLLPSQNQAIFFQTKMSFPNAL